VYSGAPMSESVSICQPRDKRQETSTFQISQLCNIHNNNLTLIDIPLVAQQQQPPLAVGAPRFVQQWGCIIDVARDPKSVFAAQHKITMQCVPSWWLVQSPIKLPMSMLFAAHVSTVVMPCIETAYILSVSAQQFGTSRPR
jgi:hypothetical protein